MSRHDAVKVSVVRLLRTLKVTPNVPLDLVALGPPLMGEGFLVDEIIEALDGLQDDKVIELIRGNRLVLMMPLENT